MALGLLELDFQMVVRHLVGDGNCWESNSSPLEEQHTLLTTELPL